MITHQEFDKMMSSGKPLTREEEYSVFEYYENNRTEYVKNRICEKYIGLISLITNSIKGNGSFDSDDVFQEAFFGLVEAVDRFDYRLGNRFSTYAKDWIWQTAVKFAKNMKGTIRLPAYIQNEIRKIKKAEDRYIEANIGERDTAGMRDYVIQNSGVSRKRVDWYYSEENTYYVSSLNQHAGNDEDNSELLDMVGSDVDSYGSFDKAYDMYHFMELIKDALSEREYRVLTMRFGIGLAGPMTVTECSRETGLSESKVKKIIQECIDRFRKQPEKYGIQYYKNYVREVS